jgi:hypothetical protein
MIVLVQYLVEVTKSLHEIVDSVRDLTTGYGLQHGQELLKGHPRVLLALNRTANK